METKFMIRGAIVLAILISQAFPGYSQTKVSGTLTSNSEWTVEGSPYILTSTVGVPAGVSLTINPGITVEGNFDLLVKGKIIINGEAGNEVIFDNTRLIFKSSNLSNSKLDYVEFINSGGIQLADETEHNQDNIKNSGVLTITNSTFKNGTYARTKGYQPYQSTAKLSLVDCHFENATIKGYYPLSEIIECNRCDINNSLINSDSYNHGIYLINSTIDNTSLTIGCCSANIKLDKCEVSNSSFYDYNNWYQIEIDSSLVINTSFALKSGHLSISNSRLISADTGLYHLQVQTTTLENTSFEGKSSIEGIHIYGFDGINNKVSSINNCSFIGYKNAVSIDDFNTFTFKSNSFINVGSYALVNNASKNIDATGNYWGTNDERVMASLIFDGHEDVNSGIVNFSNYLTSPGNDIPIMEPQNLFKGIQGDNILLSWDANSETDFAGYKIYFKSDSLDKLTLLADVGNVTTYLTNAIEIDDFVVITAYNQEADGAGDTFEGNESVYSDYAKHYFSAELVPTSFCSYDSFKVEISKNYKFTLNNYFILQLSEVDGGFENAIKLDSASSDSDILISLFPDTLEYGKEYLIRVFATELGVNNSPASITYNQYPALAFETSASTCFNENYQINYIGSTEGEITWDFNGANIISGSGPGPYLLKWNSPGEKAINFSMNNNGCRKDTTINVTIAPEPIVPEICIVTVDKETNKNMLVWSYELETAKSFGIYRETNVADQYSLIEFIDGGTFNTYVDKQSFPDQISNRYKITALDSCGIETDLSLYHKTVHLTINKGLGNNWNLIWDGYEGFSFGTYRIYRGTDNGNMELLTEIASNLTSYTDLNPPSGTVAYQIEVMNPNGCEANFTGRVAQFTSSKSNIARSNTITGLNDSVGITPVVLYPNPTSNEIQIIFETFPRGQYSFQDLNGKEIKSGLLEQNFEIDLTEQPRGVYFLIMNTKNGVTTKKIIRD